jgi:hypothetical protein
MVPRLITLGLVASAALSAGCRDPASVPATPTAALATVRLVFRGPTTRRTDLPASAEACVNGVGMTHTHPSWRSFAGVPLTPRPPDGYEITLTDVPVGQEVSLRVNDQNWCDQNPTGAVLRNVFANDVELAQNALTPGNGLEPGFAFRVDATGRVRQ